MQASPSRKPPPIPWSDGVRWSSDTSAEERVDEALSIIECESNGDPSVTNPRSSATGLFQFINGTWEHASEQAGFGGASALDPEANVAAAAWLVDYSFDVGRSAWAHWTCRP